MELLREVSLFPMCSSGAVNVQIVFRESVAELSRYVATSRAAIGHLRLDRRHDLTAVIGTASQGCRPQGSQGKSCIFLFLEGGPPHQDMWDPKPEAPAEIRGPFQAIKTNVPGIFVTDQLPQCAKIADKYTILRNHGHNDNGHSTGYHYVMTGRRASFADGDNPIPNNEYYPSIGSAVSRTLGAQGSLPPYINLPHPMQGGGPGFYGAEHAPFVIEADPSQPDFDVKDLQPPSELTASRLSVRKRLLAGLDKLERQHQQSTGQAMSTYYEKAYQLIASEEARRAFNIHAEPDSVRDAYGRTQLGQCALLARRLVEAGCRFVGVDAPGWDVHFNCFPSLKTDLIPYADQAFSALVTDLDQRGLLDETLVIMMGEMGRTLESTLKRDAIIGPWPRALSSLVEARFRDKSSEPRTNMLPPPLVHL